MDSRLPSLARPPCSISGNLVAIRFAVSLAGGLLLAAACPELRAAEPVSFSRQIRPLLEASCWKCHGAAMQLSRFDLRTRESALKGGEHGPWIGAGNAGESRLFRLVAGSEKPAMPMDGTKLTEEQISTIKSWIEQGAPWDNAGVPAGSAQAPAAIEDAPIPPEARKHWAFQRPVRRPAPQARNASWGRHPIDAVLLKALEKRALTPAPEADARTLVRRAYLDLTGLLPTPAESDAIVCGHSSDHGERLIHPL